MYKDYKNTPLWNSGLSEEERLQYLLQELTLDENLPVSVQEIRRLKDLGFLLLV